jgi:hypothetical protein
MPSESKSHTTTDHREIRRWVESRDGRPAHVRGTGSGGDPGVLRIDFPGGAGGEDLEGVTWDEWFDKFDREELGFLYQERKADGSPSTFNKLVQRS